MSKIIGYARVSTNEQNIQLQVDALKKAGCKQENIFIDHVSGVRTQRPGLDECLLMLQPNDTLVVWRLDRLGRSMSHLVTLVEDLIKKNIGFKSLCDGAINTTTASGELMFNIFSSLAQFERRLIQERTIAGLAAARSRGKKGGRQPISIDDPRVTLAKKMHKNKEISIKEICNTLKISRSTLYRYLSLSEKTGTAKNTIKVDIKGLEKTN